MNFSGNWVDLVIILVLIIFTYQGFVNGFWSILIDFISFFGSLLLSLKTYQFISSILQKNFAINLQIANAVGFLVSAVFIEIIISYFLTLLISKIPTKILHHPVNKIIGCILSFAQGVILVAFVITLAIALPINPKIKTDISNSQIGNYILSKTAGLEKEIDNVFGGAINQSLTYLTVEPESKTSVPLDAPSNNLTIDRDDETKMFQLVNEERTMRGIQALTWDIKLVVLGENYGKFMWQNHYFGHYDQEGHDVAYRMQQAEISYQVAGENLALAPTVEVAHTGLMNSPGHKANILDKDFKKIGIGVIDNGFYGKIFVQEFTN
ncbi:MAG TPA: CvpA family protein [Patescibacteria group bacterium]|nr:CvpA family protein [Patescibacteria group bacterium]